MCASILEMCATEMVNLRQGKANAMEIVLRQRTRASTAKQKTEKKVNK